AIWALALLLFLGLGRVGRLIDRGLEGYSTKLARGAVSLAEAGNLDKAVRRNLWGMWPHFLLFGLVTAGCALLGTALGPLVNALPLGAVRGLAWAYPALAAVAAAIAIRGSHARSAWLFATLAAAAVLLANAGVLLWRNG
ncbi:MAG TPA: hypothetical protein VK420_13950, partial [Longimicrobium sp.]|nr:hypothetical protein [Longimicrobium sp.]